MAKQFVFGVNQVPTIDVNVGCQITILEAKKSNEILVEIDADEKDLKDFIVKKSNNTVSIKQTGDTVNSGGITITNGNISIGSFTQSFSSVSGMSISQSGGNTVITGGSGKVIINGKEINLSDEENSSNLKKIPHITVYAPISDLEAKLKSTASLKSEIKLRETYLSMNGSTDANVITESLDCQLSGSSNVVSQLRGGNLNLSCSGSADINVSGTWSQANVNVSGSADINTNGTCNGNYSVNASGSADVRHYGKVLGRVRKNASGCADISIG